ncbi:MAG: hypothetical protein MUF54_24670 [Polyangiaceae bacterium]|nr:hypothetical protein [Polyangiaceae bacterium]
MTGLLLIGCSGDPARDEASAVVRVVTELRMASNDQKAIPLERLRRLACAHAHVRQTRDACVAAFQHHVRGVALGRQLGAALDGGAPTGVAAGGPDLTAQLVEMNLEIEEASRLLPECEALMAALRRRHRL